MKDGHIWKGMVTNRKPLIQEEKARSVRGGHVLGHVADFQVVDKASEEQQQTKQQEYPPEPILTVEVSGEVVREPDDKYPLD